jgi:hypothetical protein
MGKLMKALERILFVIMGTTFAVGLLCGFGCAVCGMISAIDSPTPVPRWLLTTLRIDYYCFVGMVLLWLSVDSLMKRINMRQRRTEKEGTWTN